MRGLRLLHWTDKTRGKRATFPKTHMGLDFLKFLSVLESHVPCAWHGNNRLAMDLDSKVCHFEHNGVTGKTTLRGISVPAKSGSQDP